MSAYLVCLHTHQWCAADIYLAEAFPRCTRSILLRCMALAAAQLLGSRCSHERQDTGAREDIGSTAKYGSCGRGGKCCGGRCLFAFALYFFVFFFFGSPINVPSQKNTGQSPALTASRFSVIQTPFDFWDKPQTPFGVWPGIRVTQYFIYGYQRNLFA